VSASSLVALALADQLAAVRHYECGDSWYSCPESDEGCCNDVKGDECDCYAPLMHAAAALLREQAGTADRLAALLDAIGDLSSGWTVREGEMILDRIAAAVQPPDPKGTK
jgi:hypothetical protein